MVQGIDTLMQLLANPKVADPYGAYKQGQRNQANDKALLAKQAIAQQQVGINSQNAATNAQNAGTAQAKATVDNAAKTQATAIATRDAILQRIDGISTLPYAQQNDALQSLLISPEISNAPIVAQSIKGLIATKEEDRPRVFGNIQQWAQRANASKELKVAGADSSIQPAGPTTNQDRYVAIAEQAWREDPDNNWTEGMPIPARVSQDARREAMRETIQEVAGKAEVKNKSDLKFAESIAYASNLGQQLAVIESAPKLIEAKGEITPKAKKENAAIRISGVLANMLSSYNKLDAKDAIVNTDKDVMSNLSASAGASAPGQFFQNLAGTSSQSIRSQIKNAQPLLINYIRQASEMGARGMDSTQELKFYLQAATDPTRDIQSNMAAIAVLDDAYGDGKIGDAMRDTMDSGLYRRLQKEGNRLKAGDKNSGKVDFKSIEKEFGVDSKQDNKGANVVTNPTQAEYDVLPIGAEYMFDGVLRVKGGS